MNSENGKVVELSPFEILCDYVERANARKNVVDTYHAAGESYLAFTAGNKYYLLDMQMVQEVSTSIQDITPLPFTPGWLLGLAGVRGEVFSVVDFKRFVDPSLAPQSIKISSSFIILHNEGVSSYQSTRNWLNGQAAMDGLQWLRIDLKALVTDTSFVQNVQ